MWPQFLWKAELAIGIRVVDDLFTDSSPTKLILCCPILSFFFFLFIYYFEKFKCPGMRANTIFFFFFFFFNLSNVRGCFRSFNLSLSEMQAVQSIEIYNYLTESSLSNMYLIINSTIVPIVPKKTFQEPSKKIISDISKFICRIKFLLTISQPKYKRFY